jgi:hypothetical protein
MNDDDNWIERKARRERALKAKAPAIWNEVRAAIQDACNSFNHHYCENSAEVSCTLENGRRILITRVPGKANAERVDVVVEYHNHFHRIRCSGADHSPLEFGFECSDDGTVYLIESDTDDDSGLSPDDVSEKILHIVFFPDP